MLHIERIANKVANKLSKKLFIEVQREARRLAKSKDAFELVGHVQSGIHNHIMQKIKNNLFG